MLSSDKILSRERAAEITSSAKAKGKKVVFTNGCFDILHVGHIELLERAKSVGDLLIVGLNSDDSARRLKGTSKPINSASDRGKILSSLEVVNFVTIFDEDTPYEIINELKPDVLVKGADYSLNEIVGRSVVESYGGKVVVIPLSKGYSTTKLIEQIMRLPSANPLDNE